MLVFFVIPGSRIRVPETEKGPEKGQMKKASEGMGMKNYIDLGKGKLGAWEHYVYLDTEEFLARSLFLRHMVRVKVESVMGRENETYRLVAVRVMKKDEPLFRKAMEELKGKMLLFGHKDYLTHGGGLMDLTRDMLRKEAEETGTVELPKGRVIRMEMLPEDRSA